jgi:peptide/nickel transport system substrate-binding protein
MVEQNEQQPKGLSRRSFLRYAAFGSGAAFLAACAPAAVPGAGTSADQAPDVSEATDVSSDAQATAQQGGTMVWLGHQEVAGLSPDDYGPTVQAVLIYNILNPLVYYNEFVELEPVLAESYEVSEDGLTYTFKLHEGVLFHDGTELTAEDVKYTYDFYGNPDNASTIQGNFFGIGSVEAVDTYTVVVNMDQVNAASLSNWASVPIVPAAYHAEVGEDTFRTAPIGTGAFKLREWRPAEFTELEAFEDHFRGRPYLDAIRLDVVPEPSVRMIAMQTGDADAAVWPLLVEDSIALEADPGYVVFRTLANSVKHFPLNNELPQLSDKMVRKALMHALDRQRIIDELWSGAAQVAHSNLAPKNAFYYNADLPQYAYDPAQAAAMLDEAGWTLGADGIREKDGTKLSFTCTTITGDSARRPIAELAQQMLAEVGVDMQLAEAPVASILEALPNGTMDSSLFNWTYGSTPEPDPYATLHSQGGNNFNRYFNPEMDALIEQGLQLVDPEARRDVYRQIQELFVEDVPCLYIQFDEWINPFSARIGGLPENPLSGDPIFYAAHKLWINES